MGSWSKEHFPAVARDVEANRNRPPGPEHEFDRSHPIVRARCAEENAVLRGGWRVQLAARVCTKETRLWIGHIVSSRPEPPRSTHDQQAVWKSCQGRSALPIVVRGYTKLEPRRRIDRSTSERIDEYVSAID